MELGQSIYDMAKAKDDVWERDDYAIAAGIPLLRDFR